MLNFFAAASLDFLSHPFVNMTPPTSRKRAVIRAEIALVAIAVHIYALQCNVFQSEDQQVSRLWTCCKLLSGDDNCLNLKGSFKYQHASLEIDYSHSKG